jgi:hypothetical protein
LSFLLNLIEQVFYNKVINDYCPSIDILWKFSSIDDACIQMPPHPLFKAVS